MAWLGPYPDWWIRKMLWPHKWKSILMCSPKSLKCRAWEDVYSLLLHCCSLRSHSYRNTTTAPAELWVQLNHCSLLPDQLLALYWLSPAQERSWTPPCPGAAHPMLPMENCSTQELYFPHRNQAESSLSSLVSVQWLPDFLGIFAVLRELAKFTAWNRKCARFFKCIKDPKY